MATLALHVRFAGRRARIMHSAANAGLCPELMPIAPTALASSFAVRSRGPTQSEQPEMSAESFARREGGMKILRCFGDFVYLVGFGAGSTFRHVSSTTENPSYKNTKNQD